MGPGVALARTRSADAAVLGVVSKSVQVFDARGDAVRVVSGLELPASIRRIVDARLLRSEERPDLVIYAAYGAIARRTMAAVARRGPTLILTSAYARTEAVEALDLGLIGYVELATPADALRRALCGVLMRDEAAFSRDTVGHSVRGPKHPASPTADPRLTRRQNQIVTLIAAGATDKEIARVLGIACATAQKHVAAILARLGVPNRAAAAVAILTGKRSLS